MTESPEAAAKPEPSNWFAAWVQNNRRQALALAFVTSLLVFALIRGFVSDNSDLAELTETAKERWQLIQSSQERFYATNGRYAGATEALDGADAALDTPAEKLHLNIKLGADGDRVEMTMTGRTIRLSRTLMGGDETDANCRILLSRAGEC